MAQNAFGMSNTPGQAGTSSAGQSFISTLVARMPYTYKVLQNAIEANPKYDIFNDLTSRKVQRVGQQSILQNNENASTGMMLLDRRYHQIMYADVDTDKVRRIMEYRKMAGYAELADCIEEISDEAIVKDDQGIIVKLLVRGEHDKIIIDAIKDEWNKFITNFDLENKGWEYIRQFLIEGELYFENVISENRPDYGIIGVVQIPTELINTIYDNVQNQIIQGYLLRRPIINPKKTITTQTQEELIVLDKNQVTYMHSGLWNEDRTIRLPYIENSRRAYKQLSLVEDSIIIYRLVRAPERLVFKVDVGNMPVPKAEEYIKKLMQQYWARKNFDNSQGRVGNVYDPQSMLDAYWFTKRGNAEGTEVTSLPGGCLSMDTKIPLLDGRTLSIEEIAKEHEKGKQNWVYSCNPKSGRIFPGKISWAGVTQKSAKVMKLTFDNNQSLICTPDHKFPTILRGKKRADELEIGDSIHSLYRRKRKITNKTTDYEQVYQHDTKTWEFTHRMVATELKNTKYIKNYIFNENYIDTNNPSFTTIHHVNIDQSNNSPENLVWMNRKDHYKMHGDMSSSIINNKISKGLIKYISSLNKEERENRAQISRKNWRKGSQAFAHRMRTDKEFNKKHSDRLSKILTETFKDPVKRQQRTEQNHRLWKNNYIWRQAVIEANKNRWKDPVFAKQTKYNMSLHFTEDSLKTLVDLIKETGITQQKQLAVYLNSNPDNKFSKQFRIDNPNQKIWNGKFGWQIFSRMVKSHGYKNYSQFRKEFSVYNHKIIKIEFLDEPIQVGTLTIDKDEEIHDYHTFVTSSGVMTYNSNLGQLDDLMYFVKKLYKSLKVPASRLDPADPFKDGTEITREELRFARFIIRIQNQIAQGLKQSFITHLQLREKNKADEESKSLWQKFKLREHHIHIEFNPPSYFATMREQQIFDLKSNNFQKLTGSELISQSFAQKYYLGLTDKQMAENREWLRKDAALSWEIQNIVSSGPGFRKQMAAVADLENVAAGGIPTGPAPGAGGGSALPGGGELPPEFGPGPETGTTPAEPQANPATSELPNTQ